MNNLKSFKQFINENLESTIILVESCVSDILNILSKEIESNSSNDINYIILPKLEYNDDEYKVDIEVEYRLDNSPDIPSDSHFKTLPWEEINFNHYGFAIDSNMIINNDDLIIPKIVVSLIINPELIPKLYKELNYRLIDIITHELNHTQQIGINRKPFNVRPSDHNTRDKADCFKYLILPEEVESMVEGMYVRSKKQGVQIDKIFDKTQNF